MTIGNSVDKCSNWTASKIVLQPPVCRVAVIIIVNNPSSTGATGQSDCCYLRWSFSDKTSQYQPSCPRMVSAMMSARTVAVSRPSMALKTQVGQHCYLLVQLPLRLWRMQYKHLKPLYLHKLWIVPGTGVCWSSLMVNISRSHWCRRRPASEALHWWADPPPVQWDAAAWSSEQQWV